MSTRVLVIGGGIVGASVAMRCAVLGASVFVLDDRSNAENATRASFAWLNANNKTPRAYFDLNVTGMREYATLGDEFASLTATRTAGNSEWAESDEGLIALREKVERLRRWGYSAELLPVEDLARIEPGLGPPPAIEQFAWFPEEGYVEPDALAQQTLDIARERGATILLQTSARRFVANGSRVQGVETDGGDIISADLVVMCAGPRSDELLATIDITLPMDPRVGMVARTTSAPQALSSVHHDELMHIRPAPGGRILMRHTDFDEAAAPGEIVPDGVLEKLRDRVSTVLPHVANVEFEWARVAVRPIPADGYPAVGFWPEFENLYVAVTHSGVTLGPLLGRLAAAEMLQGVRAPELEPFRPDRFTGE